MVAFGLFVWLAGRRAQYPWFAREGWVRRDVEDLLFYGVLGVVLGGRLGYVSSTSRCTTRRTCARSSRSGTAACRSTAACWACIVAMALFAWQRKRPFLQVTDLIAPCVPLGLASGRVGNFINGELWGRFADPSLPWAMVFPESGSQLPRHPSQIYQFLGEGILLFVILWIFGKKERGRGQVSGLFLVGYGVLRFAAEFFRARTTSSATRHAVGSRPAVASAGAMGQWLCVPMVIAGALMFAWGARQPRGVAGPAI